MVVIVLFQVHPVSCCDDLLSAIKLHLLSVSHPLLALSLVWHWNGEDFAIWILIHLWITFTELSYTIHVHTHARKWMMWCFLGIVLICARVSISRMIHASCPYFYHDYGTLWFKYIYAVCVSMERVFLSQVVKHILYIPQNKHGMIYMWHGFSLQSCKLCAGSCKHLMTRSRLYL